MIARGSQPTDILSVEDRTGTQLSSVQFGMIRRPDGGSADILIDGREYDSLQTRQPTTRYAQLRLAVEGVGKRIELRPRGDGPVDLTEIGLFGADRGIELSNLGFPGAQIGLLDKWHWETVKEQLGDIRPGLVILAFGTNEGFAPAERIASGYERLFERQLRAVKAAVPGSALAVIGPPDANRYPRYCLPSVQPEPAASQAKPDAGTTPSPEAKKQDAEPAPPDPARPQQKAQPSEKAKKQVKRPEPPPDAICSPLSPSERPHYDAMIGAKDRALCRWHTPAAIPLVRRIQRQVAERNGVFFWDWSEVFDGECGADRWARRGLASKDRVHFTPQGYALAAERFYAALLTGYARPR